MGFWKDHFSPVSPLLFRDVHATHREEDLVNPLKACIAEEEFTYGILGEDLFEDVKTRVVFLCGAKDWSRASCMLGKHFTTELHPSLTAF